MHLRENLLIQLDGTGRTYTGDPLLRSENTEACAPGHARRHFSGAFVPHNEVHYVLEADRQPVVPEDEVHCVLSAGRERSWQLLHYCVPQVA